jgi:hypothetical protein
MTVISLLYACYGNPSLAERLEEVCSLDLDQLDIALPRGFGRDEPAAGGLAPPVSMWYKWVGTERGPWWPVSPSPPLKPYVRLSPHTASAL